MSVEILRVQRTHPQDGKCSTPREISGWSETLEEDAGFVFVRGTEPFVEAALFGDTKRGKILGMDEADGAGIVEAPIGPGQGGANGFRPVAFAVHRRREGPAGFAKVFDGWLGLAKEMGDADFAGEGAGGFFFDQPEAETKERPVPGVALEFEPGFFLREGAAADELRDARVGPHFAAGGKILDAMAAETQARRFENGKFGVERKGLQRELLGNVRRV